MLDLNKVYCGDSEQVLKEIDDETIDLVVTSPPYSNLRHYNNSLTEWNNEKFDAKDKGKNKYYSNIKKKMKENLEEDEKAEPEKHTTFDIRI